MSVLELCETRHYLHMAQAALLLRDISGSPGTLLLKGSIG